MTELLARIATPIVTAVLLVLVLLFGTVAVVQSVRINGFEILGWELSEGYKPMAVRLGNENGRLIGNNLALSSGLDKCNLGVAALEKTRLSLVAAAQKLVDEQLRLQQEYANRVAKLNSIKPTGATCPSVDTIFNTGFGK